MEPTIKFKKKEFKNIDLMVTYRDIFPESNRIFLNDENEIQYELKEAYCKNPECDCTETMIHFVPENKKNVISFRYDYVTQDNKNVPDFAKSLFQEDVFNELLLNRNKAMRLAFENKVLSQKNAALRLNIKKNSIQQLNRNDTCFCGSGKKYKKCCMNL